MRRPRPSAPPRAPPIKLLFPHELALRWAGRGLGRGGAARRVRGAPGALGARRRFLPGMSGPGGPGPGGGKLDINRAGVAELEGALSGIGRRRARGIVRKREVRAGAATRGRGRAWAWAGVAGPGVCGEPAPGGGGSRGAVGLVRGVAAVPSVGPLRASPGARAAPGPVAGPSSG